MARRTNTLKAKTRPKSGKRIDPTARTMAAIRSLELAARVSVSI